MPSLKSLLGEERRSGLLVLGHVITGLGGIGVYALIWILIFIAFFLLGKPAQLYGVGLFFMQLIAVLTSVMILVFSTTSHPGYWISVATSALGLAASAASVFDRIIFFIYYSAFSWDCFFSEGKLTVTDLRICQSGDADNGPIFPFLLLIINIVLTIHIIVAIITFLGDFVWNIVIGAKAQRSTRIPDL